MHGVGGSLLWLDVCADGSGPPGTLGHDVIEVRAALIVGVGGPPPYTGYGASMQEGRGLRPEELVSIGGPGAW